LQYPTSRLVQIQLQTDPRQLLDDRVEHDLGCLPAFAVRTARVQAVRLT
jgi:hypothetical protein